MGGTSKGCSQKMYDENCKGRFDEIERVLKDRVKISEENTELLQHINKRLFYSNGKRSMVEENRDIKKALDRHLEEHKETAPKRYNQPKTVKVSVGKFFNAENVAAVDLIKIILAALIFLLLGGEKLLELINSIKGG
jgi:hypothetical protein